MNRIVRLLLAFVASTGFLVVGCGSDSDGSSGSITVSAATSLTEAFTQMKEDFEAENPDATVTFNFDSSTTLSDQIIEGADADVYASADEANMTKLIDEDLVDGEPEIFARNELIIVTKPGNPEGITGLADLADVGVIALCGEDVPCGKFAKEVLDGAGVAIPEDSVTRGQNVKATLSAVSDGDAVAGIVYVTDVGPVGDAVDSVAIPAAENALATYPIGVLKASSSEVADAFKEYVLSDEGQAVLKERGFLPPT